MRIMSFANPRFFLAGLLALAGCGGTTPSGGDGGTGGNGGDLAMSNLPTLSIRWSLEDCNISGMQCGFSTTCGDAAASKLVFTVLDPKTNAKVVTTIDCPKDSAVGFSTINLPNNAGPFTIYGAIDGNAKSSGKYVCGIVPTDNITVTIYYKGCDDARCGACP